MSTRGIILILLLLTINFISATSNYDPSDPNTWSSHDLKEWLAEHRVSYSGIPEKHDLVILVKAHWVNVKDQAKSTSEAVEKFVTKYYESIKDTIVGADDQSIEFTEFTRQIADQFENARQYAGLTEEQIGSVFDRINEKLKENKITSKNLTKSIDQIKRSYAMAKARRDKLIQEAANKIQLELADKGLSQETIDWFKEEINKLGEDAAFSKSRLGTQACLVLQGIQERLAQFKVATPEQIKETNEKLKSAIGDVYQSFNGSFERLRKELTDTIGSTAENVVDELKSQFSTVNDYRLMTQEKIQNIIDRIGQKLQDGKTITVEQLQKVKDSIGRYFDTFKYYYNSATGQTKQMVFE
ncbi:16783_t:CDS:2, partial [Acaulospora morrowiae]